MRKRTLLSTVVPLAALVLVGCGGSSFHSGEKVYIKLPDAKTHMRDAYAIGDVVQQKGKMVQVTIDKIHDQNDANNDLLNRLENSQGTQYVPAHNLMTFKKGMQYQRHVQAFQHAVQQLGNLSLGHGQKEEAAIKAANKALSTLPKMQEYSVGMRIFQSAVNLLRTAKHASPSLLEKAAKLNLQNLKLVDKHHFYVLGAWDSPSMNFAMLTLKSVDSDFYSDLVPNKGFVAKASAGTLEAWRKGIIDYKLSESKIDSNDFKEKNDALHRSDIVESLDETIARKSIKEAVSEAGFDKVKTVAEFKTAAAKFHSMMEPVVKVIGAKQVLKSGQDSMLSDWANPIRSAAVKAVELKQQTTMDGFNKAVATYAKLVKPISSIVGPGHVSPKSKDVDNMIPAMRTTLANKIYDQNVKDNRAFKNLSAKYNVSYWGKSKRSPSKIIANLHKYLKAFPKGKHVAQAKKLIKQEQARKAKIIAHNKAVMHHEMAALEGRLRKGFHTVNYGVSVGQQGKLYADHISKDGHFSGYIKYQTYNGAYVENNVKGRVIPHYASHKVEITFKEVSKRRLHRFNNDITVGWRWDVEGRLKPLKDGVSLQGKVHLVQNGQKAYATADMRS